MSMTLMLRSFAQRRGCQNMCPTGRFEFIYHAIIDLTDCIGRHVTADGPKYDHKHAARSQ
jgi:hypothetical protein